MSRFVFVLFASATAFLHAQPNQSAGEVAAKFGDDFVFVTEVEREVAKVVGDRKIEPQARRTLQAEALARLIRRRLILQFLARKKAAPSEQDIKLAIDQARNRLKQQALTLEEFLKRGKVSAQEFRRTLEWQLGWQRYLDFYVTDKNLLQHFQNNQRQFDGTQLRVSQILIKVKRDAGGEVWKAAEQKADKIRADIVAGDVDFAAAAKMHSDSPSAAKGGDIGLISRHEPMPESFSRAAFALEKGKVSSPVTSAFGVHLIQCVEIQPGQKQLDDVRKEVETDLVRFLFDWVSDRERPNATIEYTGKTPHFKPGTRKLAK